MEFDEPKTDEITSLRRQIRLLAIVLFGVCVLAVGLMVRDLVPSTSGWPHVSSGKLQVKQLVLMTDDGKPAGLLRVVDGAAGLALLDAKGKARVLITTAENSGLIQLSADGEEGSTTLKNGTLLMGNEKIGGILVQSPPSGGPQYRVFDSSGYEGVLGRSLAVDKSDGTVSETSAAALMGSSKDRASTWSLLRQPVQAPALTNAPSNTKAKGSH